MVDANVGRGLLAFFNCVIVSGQNAFSLNPGHVARSRLEADLVLTRCSIASENSIISFGRWTGSDPGPDRPWLVTTQNCLFVASYDKPDVPSVLLRADPVSLAHGTVFWQASGDAFEVPVFLATGATTPPSTSASRKPDVNQQWASLWGEAHFHNVSGPKGPTGVPGTRLAAKLRVGDVEPADLAIDPNYPPRRSHHELGVDFTALGINPANRAGNKR